MVHQQIFKPSSFSDGTITLGQLKTGNYGLKSNQAFFKPVGTKGPQNTPRKFGVPAQNPIAYDRPKDSFNTMRESYGFKERFQHSNSYLTGRITDSVQGPVSKEFFVNRCT